MGQSSKKCLRCGKATRHVDGKCQNGCGNKINTYPPVAIDLQKLIEALVETNAEEISVKIYPEHAGEGDKGIMVEITRITKGKEEDCT